MIFFTTTTPLDALDQLLTPITVQIYRAAYFTYAIVRRMLTAIGLFKPLRKWLGPQAGRFASSIAANVDRPTMVHGHQMFLATAHTYPPVAMATDRYEQETTQLFECIVRPGMVVIDVGAHVGYYSLLAARKVGPEGRVYAFEPEPSNYDLLLNNIDLNGYENIVPSKIAISNKVGQTTLFLTALDNGRSSTYHHGLPEKGGVTVETTTLDAWLEAEGWPEIGLIKVDVEGAELDVLEGMGQLLRKERGVKLIIEFNPMLLRNAGTERPQLLDQLTGWGFEVHPVVNGRGPVPMNKLDWGGMVDQLVTSEGSLNLYCFWQ